GLHNESQCTDCTGGFYCELPGKTEVSGPCQKGHYCPSRSISSTSVICPAGRYCPIQTEMPKLCPRGTFSNNTGLWSDSQCTICTAGSYCGSQGLTEPSGLCRAGFYCPEGSQDENAVPCTIGLHCPTGYKTPIDCPEGTFTNTTTSPSCQDCPEGFYCVPENVTSGDPTSGYHTCPRGYYCPAGTGRDWKSCPRGTYSNTPGLSRSGQCKQCDPGKFCGELHATSYTGDCLPGYYCVSGVDYSTPAFFVNDSHCKDCPSGYFCHENSTTYVTSDCPPGSYCPLNTTHAREFLCPPGRFNALPNQKTDGACVLCTGGKYCEGHGLSGPTADCMGGWYCVNGSSKATPDGAKCQPGYYCPNGSANPIQCDRGKYCPTEGLLKPFYDCEGGHYCNLGASVPRPTDGVTGNVCPKGSYCPRGTPNGPLRCPLGTFANETGYRNETDCRDCTQGWFCDDLGLEEPKGQCMQGYYCDGRATHSQQHPCPKGHICPTGSPAPVPCGPGYHQNETRQWTCKKCPPGFYCNDTYGPVVDYAPFECIEGHYCPEGTRYATQFKCPPGSFNNQTGTDDVTDCLDCTGGFVCDEWGLVRPNRLCGPGYFCRQGANMTTPDLPGKAEISTAGKCTAGYYCPTSSSSPTQMICPQGHYCMMGTHHPEPCPSGTFSNGTQLIDSSKCIPCREGWYCDSTGLVQPKDECDPGFFCPEGQNKSNPYPCPVGKYCPRGSPSPKDCVAGTFAENAMASQCQICPQKYYCVPEKVIPGNVASTKTLCPEGWFCPNGTGWNWQACPSGTYSNQKGLAREQDCTPCDGGKVCRYSNLTSPDDDCAPGFFCSSGAAMRNPTMTNLTHCPTHFAHVTIGGICPRGYFSIAGSAECQGCTAGTYNNQEGQSSCLECPAGYYCYANTTDFQPFPCPAGHYCQKNTPTPHHAPCPPGTFNPKTGGNSSLDCLPCTPGTYCQGFGNAAPTNSCAAGYYCPGGDQEARPAAFRCQRGYYCPERSHNMTKCTPGKYCDTVELPLPVADCDAGFYCPLGSDSRTKVRCPEGHYCPKGSEVAIPCEPGFYLPGFEHKNKSECTLCEAGWYCNISGLAAPQGHHQCDECPEAYFCDNSAAGVSDLTGFECPTGHYCPKGTKFATEFKCPQGTWSNQTKLIRPDECFQCPARYFCQKTGLSEPEGLCLPGFYCNGSITQPNPPEYVCPRGHYCTEGSYVPIPCPRGSFANTAGNKNVSDCRPCSPGHYCDPNDSIVMERECSPGYVCILGSTTPTPTDGIEGKKCPMGHFCTKGTIKEEACQPGTYAPRTGLSVCDWCPPGYTCPNTTVIDPAPCSKGHYCPGGTSLPMGEPCPIGTYLPTEFGKFKNDCLACPPGMYCDRKGQANATGPCMAGYLCRGGARFMAPNDTSDPYNGPCPPGYFCLE
ncbi:predicted protein, partial [Nematostella vectensis]